MAFDLRKKVQGTNNLLKSVDDFVSNIPVIGNFFVRIGEILFGKWQDPSQDHSNGLIGLTTLAGLGFLLGMAKKNETEEEHRAYLDKRNEQRRLRIQNESPEEQAIRLEKKRNLARKYRLNQSEASKEREKQLAIERRENWSEVDRQENRDYQREYRQKNKDKIAEYNFRYNANKKPAIDPTPTADTTAETLDFFHKIINLMKNLPSDTTVVREKFSLGELRKIPTPVTNIPAIRNAFNHPDIEERGDQIIIKAKVLIKTPRKITLTPMHLAACVAWFFGNIYKIPMARKDFGLLINQKFNVDAQLDVTWSIISSEINQLDGRNLI